ATLIPISGICFDDCRATAFHVGGPKSYNQVVFFAVAEQVQVMSRNRIEMPNQNGLDLGIRRYDQQVCPAAPDLLHFYRQPASFEIVKKKTDYLVFLSCGAVNTYEIAQKGAKAFNVAVGREHVAAKCLSLGVLLETQLSISPRCRFYGGSFVSVCANPGLRRDRCVPEDARNPFCRKNAVRLHCPLANRPAAFAHPRPP